MKPAARSAGIVPRSAAGSKEVDSAPGEVQVLEASGVVANPETSSATFG